MPSLDRRVHYQAAEEGRESVQLVDTVGRELTEEEAIAQLGGKKAAYTELISAPSRMEAEALCARRPEMDREDAAKAHFAAQAKELDPTGRAVVAIHGNPDGGYHAHILLPGGEQEYCRTGGNGRVQKLQGANGQAQNAWNKVWAEGRPEVSIVDWEAHQRSKDLGQAIRSLNFKATRKGIVQERKDALNAAKTLDERHSVKESFSQKETDLETRHHELQLARLKALFTARGQAGSLDHQVEMEREHYRHMAEVHRAEARLRGQEAYQARYTSADQREAFKHLSAKERKPVRGEALGRELIVLKARFEAEKSVIEQDQSRLPEDKAEFKAEQDRRCEEACKGALLHHQASLLRDREEDISRAPGQSFGERWVRRCIRTKTSRIPGASLVLRAQALQARTEILSERHSLESQALMAEARSRGLQGPSVKAMVKLDAQQGRERNRLAESKAKLALLTPARQATRTLKRTGTRVISGVVAKARQGVRKFQEVAKNGRWKDEPRSLEHLEAGQKFAEGVVLGAVAGVAKVALTGALETGKAALHQVQNAGQAVAVTAQAIASGVINPLAGAKVASEGYARVGANAAKDAVQDAQSAGKAVTKDAFQAGRDSAQQALGGFASMGCNALPQELQASIRASKEMTIAAIKTAKSLITLDLIGAGTSAGEGAIGVVREGGGMLRGSLPMPLEKAMELAAKVPLLGIVAQGAKLGLELGDGAAKAAKVLGIDR